MKLFDDIDLIKDPDVIPNSISEPERIIRTKEIIIYSFPVGRRKECANQEERVENLMSYFVMAF